MTTVYAKNALIKIITDNYVEMVVRADIKAEGNYVETGLSYNDCDFEQKVVTDVNFSTIQLVNPNVYMIATKNTCIPPEIIFKSTPKVKDVIDVLKAEWVVL